MRLSASIAPGSPLAISAIWAAIRPAITPWYTSSALGKPKMFGRRDIAEIIGPGGPGYRSSYGGGNVVVACRNVSWKRPENIKGAPSHNFFWSMTLAVIWLRGTCPGPSIITWTFLLRALFGKFPKGHQLFQLGPSVASRIAPGRKPSPRLRVTSYLYAMLSRSS